MDLTPGQPIMALFADAIGEQLRQLFGIDGTTGDAQDVPHPFVGVTYCLACGLARCYPKHTVLSEHLAEVLKIVDRAYRAGREDAARAVLAMPDAELPRSRVDRVWVALVARGEDGQPRCTCPGVDVTTVSEMPGSRTVKGLDSNCPICGSKQPRTDLKAVGDNPEEQR